MAAEMILVNPRRKRRSSRRMSPLQRKYFGKRRSRISRARSNPRRRRRSYRVTRARRNPVRHYRRRRISRVRRNPSRIRRYAGSVAGYARGAMGFVRTKLLPGAIGAGGALAVDLAYPYISPYAPAILTTGLGAAATRLALAVGIGYTGRMVGGRQFGDEVMNGAIIVTLYDVLKGYAVAAEPALFGTPAASQCATAQISMRQCQCCGTSCCPAGCGCSGNSVGVFVDGLGWTSAGRQVGVYC